MKWFSKHDVGIAIRVVITALTLVTVLRRRAGLGSG